MPRLSEPAAHGRNWTADKENPANALRRQNRLTELEVLGHETTLCATLLTYLASCGL